MVGALLMAIPLMRRLILFERLKFMWEQGVRPGGVQSKNPRHQLPSCGG